MRTTKVLAVGMLDERKKENSIVYPDGSSTLANTVHIISESRRDKSKNYHIVSGQYL